MLTSPVHLSRPHHYLNQQQHQQSQQQPHQQNQTFYQHTPASAAAFQHHLQQLKDFDTLSQQFQSTSQPQHNFSSTPLTPAPSQSHSINLPYSSTPPSAGASPTYSCPAFSTHNSPDFASSSLFQGSSDSFMTDHSFSDSGALPHTPPPPPIKVFRSTPPETAEETFDQEDLQRASMLLQSGFPYDSEINSLLSPSKFDQNSSRAQLQRNNNKTHRRTHSSSSNVSLPSSTAVPSLSPSSINTNNGNGNYQGYNNNNNNGIYERSQSTSKLLPTPEHTPVQGSFLAHPFQSYDPSSRHVTEAEIGMAMRRAVLGQGQGNAEDEITFPYSLAPSVSTLSQNSPATPHTSYADELDDGSKTISHGETNFSDIDLWMDNYLRFDLPTDLGNAQMNPPKTNRTVSNVYQDDLYNPSAAQPRRQLPQQQQQQQQQSNGQFYQSDAVMGDRLRATKQGHIGHSPSSISRQASPLRQTPYVQPTAYHSAHLQQPSHANSGLREMELLGQESMSQEEPKTISPKDAVLDYRESPGENNAPLFQPDVSDYDIATTMGTSDFTPGNNFPAFHHPTAAQIPQAFYLQQNQGAALDQRHMIQNLQDQAHPDSKLLNRTPDFPAQIPSMESTNNSDQNSSHGVTSPTGMFRKEAASSPQGMMRRPEDTSADSGTYSCTYHGCTQRFESPAKLQKHKREAHRQTTPGSHGLARDGSAGRGLSARNSQAGPHKCERINPATGKPCNSIFSRPYDLTRHEDTIHNARKQKVRCHLCTEEKTFSRNDALTRHMRVVHPGVEWPGKQRRRGRE